MALTEKGRHALELITNAYEENEWFTAKSLSDVCEETIAPATLTALAKQGYLTKRDTKPVEYSIANESANNDLGITISTAAVDTTNSVEKLFKVKSEISDKINKTLHWMDNATYASEPGSQRGIYYIIEKPTGRVLYVGQTGGKGEQKATFDSRWKEHKNQLVNNTHHCAGLQTYFNDVLNGNLDSLEFAILEELPADEELINNRERYWIDYFGDACLNTMRPSLLGKEPMTLPEIRQDVEVKTEAGLKVIVSEVSKAIHEYLYSAIKLGDYEKATLIASIVIALNYPSFKKTYKEIDDADYFLTQFKNATDKAIQQYSGIRNGVEALQATFDFIQHNEGFRQVIEYSNKKYITLQFLTEIIEASVCEIANRYPTYDVMGAFYSEFTSKSGADQQDLGVVMTPHHIADFMGDLIEITDDDVIADICCGTGALLLSADNETAKPNKMVGVEYQPRMMALTLANMIMRKADSALFVGDSFNEDILKKVKAEKPTKLIINPPYSQADFPELGFVKRGLDVLQEGGLGVAIVPMSCAIKNDKTTKGLKESILKEHELLGVWSCPDQLFYPVGVVTCIMLFKAHSTNKNKAFFGYMKDDGFEITRVSGRMDTQHKWADIKQEMLQLYRSQIEKDGITVFKEVKANDEWCAEAYMKTDYKNIDKLLFLTEMKNYILFNMERK